MRLRFDSKLAAIVLGAALQILPGLSTSVHAEPCTQEASSEGTSISPELELFLKKIGSVLDPLASCDDCNGTGTRGGGQWVYIADEGVRFLDMLTDAELARAIPIDPGLLRYSGKCDSSSIRKFHFSEEQAEELQSRLESLNKTAPEVATILGARIDALLAKTFTSNLDFGKNLTDGWRQSARLSPEKQETLAFFSGNLLILREPPLSRIKGTDLLPALSHEAFRQFTGGDISGNGSSLSLEEIEKATQALWRERNDEALVDLFQLKKGRAFMTSFNDLLGEMKEALQTRDPEKSTKLLDRIQSVLGDAVGDQPLPASAENPPPPLWLRVQMDYPQNIQSLVEFHRLYEPIQELLWKSPSKKIFAGLSALNRMELLITDQSSRLRVQAAARKAYEQGARNIEEALEQGNVGAACFLFLESIRRQPSRGAK